MPNQDTTETTFSAETSEAFRTLRSVAHGNTGAIPPELLVRHVMRITDGADWPVRRAAMEACLRRFDFARRDGLRVAARPPRGAVRGVYRTRRTGSPQRPYETLLERLDPLSASCDCPDFARGSLGLCKHVLIVLDDLVKRPRRFRQALADEKDRRPRTGGGARLEWDPIRPLVGPGDWLERIGMTGARGDRRKAVASVRRRFRAGGEDRMAIKDAFAANPRKRLELVEALLPLVRPPGRSVDLPPQPALRGLLEAERSRLARVTSAGDARRRVLAALRSMKRRLYPYQIEGVLRAIERGTFMIADDMGLGKTAQAIATCHALWHSGLARRALVIAPASLKPQWLREWQLFSDVPIQVVDGQAEARRQLYGSRRAGCLIANYEQVLRDLKVITRWSPGIVVLDEAQRIKNWATKTAGYVKALQPPYRLVLTGTPLENRLEELASILEWVDDMALEPKWRLGPWHSIHADGKATETIGARNLETLRQRLAPCMLRRVRRDVLEQLPPRTDTTVPVDLTPAQLEEHDAMARPIAALASIAKRRPLTQAEFLKLMRLLTAQRMIANGLAQYQFAEHWPKISGIKDPGPALLRSLDSPKLIELREILAQLAVDQGRKVVVFSQWRRMLRLAHWAVAAPLAAADLRAAFFSGEESQRRRTSNLVEFHDDPALRVLFATDAGGVGLNLQRAATCCVNLELPWNPAVLEQRVGRIYRLGQEQPIDVYNLVSRDCVEERIASLVSGKKQLFDGLFDGTSDEIRFETSGGFMSAVSRLVQPQEAPPALDEQSAESEEVADEELERAVDLSDAIEPDEAADETAGEGDARLVEVKPAARGGTVRELLAALTVKPRDDGGIVIEAPPEAASDLAALLESLASQLRSNASTGSGSAPAPRGLRTGRPAG